MPSLNLDIDFFTHWKTKRLIRLLGKGSEVVPLRLWCYAARYFAEDGRLTGISAQEIEDEVLWWGAKGDAVNAMVSCQFLELDGDTYVVHEWAEHEGHITAFHERAKAGAKERWRRYREGDASSDASSNAPTVPTKPTKPDQPNEEYFADLIPQKLNTPAFVQSWRDFVQHRKEIKHPFKPTAARKALKKLANYSEVVAIQAMDTAAGNGWTGVFPENVKGATTPANDDVGTDPSLVTDDIASAFTTPTGENHARNR